MLPSEPLEGNQGLILYLTLQTPYRWSCGIQAPRALLTEHLPHPLPAPPLQQAPEQKPGVCTPAEEARP